MKRRALVITAGITALIAAAIPTLWPGPEAPEVEHHTVQELGIVPGVLTPILRFVTSA